MSYPWQILRAAVEQEIQFPNRKAYEAYIDKLERKGMPYEVVVSAEKPDGDIVVLMRKRYNPQNAFMRNNDRASRWLREWKLHWGRYTGEGEQ